MKTGFEKAAKLAAGAAGFGYGRVLDRPPVSDEGYLRPSGFAWSAIVASVKNRLLPAVESWYAEREARSPPPEGMLKLEKKTGAQPKPPPPAPIPFGVPLKLWVGSVKRLENASQARRVAADLISDLFAGVAEGGEVAVSPPVQSGYFSSVFKVKTPRGRGLVIEAVYKVEPQASGYDVYLHALNVFPEHKAPQLATRTGVKLLEEEKEEKAPPQPALQQKTVAAQTKSGSEEKEKSEKASERKASSSAQRKSGGKVKTASTAQSRSQPPSSFPQIID